MHVRHTRTRYPIACLTLLAQLGPASAQTAPPAQPAPAPAEVPTTRTTTFTFSITITTTTTPASPAAAPAVPAAAPAAPAVPPSPAAAPAAATTPSAAAPPATASPGAAGTQPPAAAPPAPPEPTTAAAAAAAAHAPPAPQTPPQAPQPPPGPYILPFALRSAVPGNVVRLDTSVNGYHIKNTRVGEDTAATSTVSLLTGSAKVRPDLAVLGRVGLVHLSPPTGDAATAMTNLMLGAAWSRPMPSPWRLAITGGLALPTGQGGGNDADAGKAAAMASGVLTRSAMDNAMFVSNFLTPFVGADLAWTQHGATVQAEATVLQLFRVRGDKIEKDASRTNFTSGLFGGYQVLPQLALGGELRLQRWLSTPAAVDADATRRETVSLGLGARGNFPLPAGRFLRPALSYSRGLDKPMTAGRMNILQVDLAVAY